MHFVLVSREEVFESFLHAVFGEEAAIPRGDHFSLAFNPETRPGQTKAEARVRFHGEERVLTYNQESGAIEVRESP